MNSYLIMSVWSKHQIGPELFVRFDVKYNDLQMLLFIMFAYFLAVTFSLLKL